MLEPPERPKTAEAIWPRKTHRKSRLGCFECKRRRVKCDEDKPACANCVRRNTPCSFLVNEPSNTSSSPQETTAEPSPGQEVLPIPSSTPPLSLDLPRIGLLSASASSNNSPLPSVATITSTSPGGSHTFEAFDLELWHHWLTVVCYTFADSLDGLPLWRDNIPKVSFSNSYVAQLILALSALHLARADRSRESMCFEKSNALQSIAISGMTQTGMIHNFSPVSSPAAATALWAASSLLVFCSFAKGPTRGHYLLYAEDAQPEWLGLLQGVKAIMLQNPGVIDGLLPSSQGEAFNRRVNPEDLIPGIGHAFADLRNSIDVLRAEDCTFDKYIHPVEELQVCFSAVFVRSDRSPGERIGGREGIRVNSHQVFSWLYRLHHDYLISLQDRRPMSLVILAHFLVLLAQLKDAWYLEGWVPHIMEAIRRHLLHPAYYQRLEWPAARLAEMCTV